jgi:hypothetical protein
LFFLRQFRSFPMHTGFKNTALLCSIVGCLIFSAGLSAADSTQAELDSTCSPDNSITPITETDSSVNDDMDSVKGALCPDEPGKAAGPLTSPCRDSAAVPGDSIVQDAELICESAEEDSTAETDTSAEPLSPVDTVSEIGEVAPAQAAFDTVFTEPQSDNQLALRYNGIYLSGITAAVERKIEALIDSAKGTPVGGFVIDMKDDLGRLSYTSKVSLAAKIGANTRRLRNPDSLVSKLHQNGLIACARIVSFKDPLLAGYLAEDSTYPYAVLDSATNMPWRQDNGERWSNPYDEKVQNYLLELIEELVSFGFDQIQLDYIRFPSDGKVGHCVYPVVIDSLNRADVLGLFLSKIREKLDCGHRVSLAVDVFGWVPWLHKDRNYWIGQDYDIIAQYADVICPMLYPSHFPKEFKSEYEEKRAYHIVREGTCKGVERRGGRSTGVQPYIQGFKWRAPSFGSQYLLDQMQAARESGAVGWILWNASNNYSSLWQALREDSIASKAQ